MIEAHEKMPMVLMRVKAAKTTPTPNNIDSLSIAYKAMLADENDMQIVQQLFAIDKVVAYSPPHLQVNIKTGINTGAADAQQAACEKMTDESHTHSHHSHSINHNNIH